MNILIVDDESPARKRLSRLVNELDGYQVVAEAKNGQEAIDLCKQHQPEIILMDIRMPGIDGLEASKTINQFDQPPAIIYCTAYSDHALQAFETHAVDYVLKPVNKERLAEALRASSKVTKAQINNSLNEDTPDAHTNQHICARVRGNLVLIEIQHIYFFQADHKYITVRHTDGEVLIEETLVSLEKKYAQQFLRIHRNALVALDKIVGLVKKDTSTHVSLKDIDETIEISRRHLPAVRKVVKSL